MLGNVKLGRGHVLGPVKKTPSLPGGYVAGRPQDEFLDGSEFVQSKAVTFPKRALGILHAASDVELPEGGVSFISRAVPTRPKLIGLYLFGTEQEPDVLGNLAVSNAIFASSFPPLSGRNNEVFFIACHPHMGGHRSIATLG